MQWALHCCILTGRNYEVGSSFSQLSSEHSYCTKYKYSCTVSLHDIHDSTVCLCEYLNCLKTVNHKHVSKWKVGMKQFYHPDKDTTFLWYPERRVVR